MQETELIKYGKYITSLVSSVILNTPSPEPFEGINWTELFHLANKHGVAVTIFPAIKEMNLPEEARLLFVKNKNKMVARTTRQNIEAEVVMGELEKNSIRYIILKGSHIKRMYPLDYLRTFGDIDLCLSESDREKAKPIMEKLGYSLDNVTDYHDEYEKNRFHIFELHSLITPATAPYKAVFDDPFSKANCVDDKGFCYELNDEYLYLHLFFHLYKHFSTTGCGIRLFADLLVYENYVKNPDWDFIESVLKEYDMLDFYSTVKNLIKYFFYDGEASESLKSIACYIFENEPNGIYKYHVANFGFWGKVKYFLKNWFPSAKDLAFRYPVLNKAPILLPVCWLRRIFYSLFFNRAAFKKQADSIKTVNSQEYKHIKNIRKMAEKSN